MTNNTKFSFIWSQKYKLSLHNKHYEGIKTLDSGTNAATWDPGKLESSAAATPGTLNRMVTPLEKSPVSKNCTSLVANRHAVASSELN